MLEYRCEKLDKIEKMRLNASAAPRFGMLGFTAFLKTSSMLPLQGVKLSEISCICIRNRNSDQRICKYEN